MRKGKITITKDNYKEIMLKRMIILCWILLAVCFMIKICGGNFFNIICSNDKFVNLCNYIDNTFWYWIVSFIFYYFGSMIYLCAVTSTTTIRSKYILIFTISLVLSYLSKFISVTFGLIVDILFIEIICAFIVCKMYKYSNKQTIIRVLLGFALINIFQIVSLFVKNLGIFKVMENNSLIQIIFSIDYYIMLILYFLYSYRKKIKRGN